MENILLSINNNGKFFTSPEEVLKELKNILKHFYSKCKEDFPIPGECCVFDFKIINLSEKEIEIMKVVDPESYEKIKKDLPCQQTIH